jgi:hypothetical protein
VRQGPAQLALRVEFVTSNHGDNSGVRGIEGVSGRYARQWGPGFAYGRTRKSRTPGLRRHG